MRMRRALLVLEMMHLGGGMWAGLKRGRDEMEKQEEERRKIPDF